MEQPYLKLGGARMLNIQEIKEIIPHRYPFLLVDKIESLEPGVKAIGYKNVSVNEPFFQGHFPTEPVMPGVLIIEALAQVGAVAMLSKEGFKGKTGYLAGVDKVRLKRKVIPGDVLKLEVEIIKLRGPIGVGKAIATVDGEIAVQGEILFAIG